ncbi:hypothetical protein RDI58_017884 [Solanum bulbocastanum]|uniref:Uncharacterized protein n=1 Tax=Solanum bulbocastanum TaxID=147425 RepID=A0AAN8TD54_SOLBU
MSLRNNDQHDYSLLYGDFAYNVAKKRENSNLHEGLDSRVSTIHSLHVSLLALPLICPLLNLSVRYSLEFQQILLKELHAKSEGKLRIILIIDASWCQKEDSYFICNHEQSIGVVHDI